MALISQGASNKKDTGYRFDEARDLVWMESSEKTALEEGDLTGDESSISTLEAKQQLGEGHSAKQFLLTRAKLLNIQLVENNSKLKNLKPQGFKTWFLTSSFLVIAFIIGFLSQQIAASDNRINLLSPPLLGLIAWNLIVYLLIFINFIIPNKKKGSGPSMRLPFRKGILLGIDKLMGKKASQSVYLKNFYSEYLPLTTSLTGYYIARVLHYSAAALAAGLIFGLWLRGFATAYVAGWESTWLYDYPHIVEVILKGLYGFLPVQDALINGLTVEKVESMRFGADYVANSAGPWLIQLMVTVAVFVLIPRIFFGLYAGFRYHRLEKSFPLDTTTPYFQNLLRHWHGKTMTIRVVPFATSLSGKEVDGLKRIIAAMGYSGATIIIEKTLFEDDPLPTLSNSQSEENWIIFSMGATGEDDVQGRFINEMKSQASKCGGLIRILVNSGPFEARFSTMEGRVKERNRSWQSFLNGYGIPYSIVNLDNQQTSTIQFVSGK